MDGRRHFETFDALRFLAFFCVFLSHLPATDNTVVPFFQKSGTIGVKFFFVLSGFLITYILLFEKQRNHTVRLKNFFIRRVLRIWPLFFAMITFAFVTPMILQILNLNSSSDGYKPNWLMSCLFLENYKMMATHSFPNVSPLVVMWSLCIEEHFYIVWGLLLYFMPIQKMPVVIGLSLIIATLSRILYSRFDIPFLDLPTNIDFFAMGAIPAYCLVRRPLTVQAFQHVGRFWNYVICSAACIYVFLSPNIAYSYQEFIDPIIFGLLFMSVIFLTLTHGENLSISKNALISRLGVYTYGLYLFHTIVINFLMRLTGRLDVRLETTLDHLLFAFLALMLSIGVSILSYNVFEKQFLKLKRHFSPEISGFADSEQ